jgi:hypothetical protein
MPSFSRVRSARLPASWLVLDLSLVCPKRMGMEDQVEQALNLVVCTTEHSSNMKKGTEAEDTGNRKYPKSTIC